MTIMAISNQSDRTATDFGAGALVTHSSSAFRAEVAGSRNNSDSQIQSPPHPMEALRWPDAICDVAWGSLNRRNVKGKTKRSWTTSGHGDQGVSKDGCVVQIRVDSLQDRLTGRLDAREVPRD